MNHQEQNELPTPSFKNLSNIVLDNENLNFTPDFLNVTPSPSDPTQSSKNEANFISSTPLPIKKKVSLATEILSINPTTLKTEIQQSSDGMGKTAIALQKILGNIELIKQFDSLRKKIKSGKASKDIIREYNIIVAKLEVKITLAEEKLRKDLKNNEISVLTAKSEQKKELLEENQKIIKTLKYVKLVEKEFKK